MTSHIPSQSELCKESSPAARTAVSLETARQRVFESLPQPRVEDVDLSNAVGRILRENVTAQEDIWPFARAAMDGIAVRFEEIEGATPGHPAALPVAAATYCGDQELPDLARGHAVRIATGAALPLGADTVIRQEIITERDGVAFIAHPTRKGEHVFPAGEDATAGEIVLEQGTRLHGGHIALLAALGITRVPVYAIPTVAILATGDELVAAQMPQGLGRVRDSNSYMLAAELESAGLRTIPLGIVPDDPQRVSNAAKRGLQAADALVVCGGASVGERDVVRHVLRGLGVKFAFEGARFKPGHPVAFGTIDRRPIFVLPGTPGACRVAFEMIVRPAALAMTGARRVDRPSIEVRLIDDLSVRPGRVRFLWARFVDAPLGPWARVLGTQGSAVLRSSAQAELLVRIDPHHEHLPAGTTVKAYLLDGAWLERIPTPQHFAAVIAIVGQKNAGKTTLIERLAPLLRDAGIRVGVIKHHAHQDALDDARRDTGRVARAGITRTLLAGPRGIVDRICANDAHNGDAGILTNALRQIDGVDLVLVEGFAESTLPRILVERSGVVGERRVPDGPYVAVVSNIEADRREAHFDWSRIDDLAQFLRRRLFDVPTNPSAGS